MNENLEKKCEPCDRRTFLGSAISASGLALAPGVTLFAVPAKARSFGQPASDKIRWGMLIDINKCPEGCNECVTACHKENGIYSNGRPASDSQWIRKVLARSAKGLPKFEVPVMCQHCESPPCVEVCPTGASMKRADGIVLVDKHTCIGCRYCMIACPYKARSFVHEKTIGQKSFAPRGKGVVESCTFCVHRIDEDRLPACVERCHKKAGGAMIFGDLNDKNSTISLALKNYPSKEIRADLNLGLGVRYQGIP